MAWLPPLEMAEELIFDAGKGVEVGRVHVWAICEELVGRRLLWMQSVDSSRSQERFAPLTLDIW